MKRKATLGILILFFFPFVWQLNAASIKENIIVAPPANDECASAVALTVNTNFLCTTTTAGTVLDATDSGITSTSSCPGASNADNDVWFKFVATDTSHKIELLNITGSNTDLYYMVFDGGVAGDCNTMTAVFCGSANPGTPSSLTVGNTYFINVFTNALGDNANTTFDICVGSTPVPPSNDDCANAEDIAGASLPFSATYDATSATNTGGSISTSGCIDINDGVWFKIIGDGTEITVIATPNSWDAAITVYEGSCGTFTCVDDSNNGASGIAEGVTFTSTSSTTYYINIAHPGITDESEGVFDLSVTSATLSIDDIVAKGFYYYPNPVKNILKMNAKESINQISLYTILGREIKRFTQSDLKAELDMSNLSSGTYFVKVVIGDSSGSFKIIKN